MKVRGKHRWYTTTPVEQHRSSYEMYVGAIPSGLELDHLCRNRACVNPRHLEPVTRSINVRRGVAPERTRERHRAARQKDGREELAA